MPTDKELKHKTGLTKPQLRRFKNTMRGHKFGPPGQKEAARVMQKVIRRHEALQLKAKGASYTQIAQQLGVNVEVAYREVQLAAGELDAETKVYAARYREIELETLDFALRNVVPIAMGMGKGVDPQHQVAAANSIVRIVERRARLLGLDAPTKIAPVTPDGRELGELSDAELDARLEALRKDVKTLPDITVEVIDKTDKTDNEA